MHWCSKSNLLRAASARTVIAGLLVVLAMALPGCNQPAGFAAIDVDAARQTAIAQGRPDPLAVPGLVKSKMPPTAVKRPR